MTIELNPEHERLIAQAIQAGLIQNVEEALDVALETLRGRLEASAASGGSARQEAVRSMQEFGDKYRLSLGEPITRKLLHEGHRY